MNQHSSKKSKYYSPLIGAALATVSLFHFSLPAFAAGTEAGQQLKNRATATYTDEDGTQEYNVTSNEVTVTVGKVAGITNVSSGLVDSNGNTTTSAITSGQTIGFQFTVTNTGNDVSDIFIPNATTIADATGTTDDLLTIDSVRYSTDGGATFTARPDSASTGGDGIIEDVPVNGEVIVIVDVTVDTNAADGDTIAVQLGNTGQNDNVIETTQNQPDNLTTDVREQDVRTETATYTNGTDAGTPKVDSDPVNGQREASALNSTTIGSNPLALPRITKTVPTNGVDNNNTPENILDDIITYNLQLDVLENNELPAAFTNFNFNAAALEGRDFSSGTEAARTTAGDHTGTVTGSGNIPVVTNLILISDAIPEGTELSEVITKPAGSLWTPVYTTDGLDTAAEDADWTETAPNLENVTRVGWVYDASANPIAAGTSITSAAGFSFKVTTAITPNATRTTSLIGNSASVYNIAQVFGSTDDGDPNDTGGTITFDESGDQNPSNYNDNGTNFTDEGVGFDDGGTVKYGFANPDPNNVDPNTTVINDGTGDGGEVNQVDLSTVIATISDLLNGPNGSPESLGTLFGSNIDDNHDFQNFSAPLNTADVVAGASVDNEGDVTTQIDPVAVVFTNAIKDDSGNGLTDVILEPVASSVLGDTRDTFDPDITLPDGTTVTISYEEGGTTSTAQYDYTKASGFNLANNNTAITIGSIAAGASVPYTVTIDLPAGTPLSTNYISGDPNNENVGGFPVGILAYVDDDASGSFEQANDTHNYTINQVYTGYLKLEKTSKIFRRNNLEDPNSAYTELTGADQNPIPGDRIEYEVKFTNISESKSSDSQDSSVTLRADDIFITEDGAAAPNNWAVDASGGDPDINGNPTTDGVIDTLHVESSAEIDLTGNVVTTSTSGIVYEKSGTTLPNDSDEELTLYRANIDELSPGEEGTFTFQRKVSEASDAPTTP